MDQGIRALTSREQTGVQGGTIFTKAATVGARIGAKAVDAARWVNKKTTITCYTRVTKKVDPATGLTTGVDYLNHSVPLLPAAGGGFSVKKLIEFGDHAWDYCFGD